MKKFKLLLILFALFALPVSRADSIKMVAQDLKYDSALPMTMGIATELAGNLLAAQAASPWLNSLDLSVQAVLRAILIYDFAGGPKQITDDCCPAVFAQSTIAIDPNAGSGVTPSALYFGEVAVATPEPETWLLALMAFGVLLVTHRKANP